MARIAVDIDGVIASTLKNGVYPRDYHKKEPLPYAIEALKQLRERNHSIYLFTARYEEDREVTEAWLRVNGFSGLYDELIMDKPKYDILIDDRALRHTDWQDTLYKVNELDRKGVYHNDGNPTDFCD